jgi:rubrerythrin
MEAQHYENKEKAKNDQIIMWIVLQWIGLALVIFTFMSVIGPIIGVILIIAGAVAYRKRKYLCRKCRNEMTEEAKVCPVCKSTYDN